MIQEAALSADQIREIAREALVMRGMADRTERGYAVAKSVEPS
jgi:hypothetical protein